MTNAVIRCLIVDDEPLAQQVIETYIAKLPSLLLVQKCGNAMEAFEALQKHAVDLLFLDVHMPVISGIEFLRSLQHPPRIILTTAYPNFAIEGFDLNVTDYLLKPISFERFLQAIHKLHGRMPAQETPQATEVQPSYFFVREDSKLVRIDFSQIDHIECMKDYAKIFTTERMIVTHQTMKRFTEMLPPAQFIRVHRSYIVAIAAIKSIYGNMIETPKARIPIGANYRDSVMRIAGS